MSINRNELYADAIQRTGREDVDNAMFDIYLKSILRVVTTTWGFVETEDDVTVTDTEAEVDKPTGFRSLISVKLTATGVPLAEIGSLHVLNAQMAADDTVGTPTSYIEFGDTLKIYPPADGNTDLTLQFTKYLNSWPAAGEASEYLVDLPDAFYEIIMEGCCFKIFEAKSLYEQAAQHKTLFNEQLALMVQRYRKQRSPVEQIES